IVKEQQRLASAFWQPQAQNAWQLACPACGKKMRRQFFVHSYPVEIDLCVSCGGIWFDVQELELLQYIYEHREEFFDLWSKLGLFLLLPTRQ
ncbi:MAG: zf-TFIIB domain-containing protein, partial [Elusimicrobia bacterium]|nr:zf-TFIIB domain-containing protein [Elusimicrobiota bacterium]